MENKLTGKALDVLELIQYQDGAVVSRTIAEKPVGTVTVFAFDEGQGLSEHTAPYDAIVHIIDGEAEIKISENSVSAKAGEIVVMPANEPHSLKAVKKFKMILIMIRA
jgi:quercetin dioxygenase-like cupin family protein